MRGTIEYSCVEIAKFWRSVGPSGEGYDLVEVSVGRLDNVDIALPATDTAIAVWLIAHVLM